MLCSLVDRFVESRHAFACGFDALGNDKLAGILDRLFHAALSARVENLAGARILDMPSLLNLSLPFPRYYRNFGPKCKKTEYDVYMIGYLEGTIRAVRENHCILVAGGVGYKIFATKETLARLEADTQASLWTYLAVRESALDLYGFPAPEEHASFELLLTVSGIGPKSALGILDAASSETLRDAISSGNAAYLTSVSGIGKKTAEKIVLELKDKVIAGSGD